MVCPFVSPPSKHPCLFFLLRYRIGPSFAFFFGYCSSRCQGLASSSAFPDGPHHLRSPLQLLLPLIQRKTNKISVWDVYPCAHLWDIIHTFMCAMCLYAIQYCVIILFYDLRFCMTKSYNNYYNSNTHLHFQIYWCQQEDYHPVHFQVNLKKIKRNIFSTLNAKCTQYHVCSVSVLLNLLKVFKHTHWWDDTFAIQQQKLTIALNLDL